MADDPDGALYQLAFEEARRAVVQQAAVLEALRSRAGMLLAVASLATSFLGGLALQDHRPKDLLAWVGVGFFAGLVALTLGMLLPRKWVFSLTARRIIGDYIEAEQPADLGPAPVGRRGAGQARAVTITMLPHQGITRE